MQVPQYKFHVYRKYRKVALRDNGDDDGDDDDGGGDADADAYGVSVGETDVNAFGPFVVQFV